MCILAKDSPYMLYKSFEAIYKSNREDVGMAQNLYEQMTLRINQTMINNKIYADNKDNHFYYLVNNVHNYYNKYKTTNNLYNKALNESRQELILFINYYYQHDEYTTNIINNLSNNKIISLSNKIHKHNANIINKM